MTKVKKKSIKKKYLPQQTVKSRTESIGTNGKKRTSGSQTQSLTSESISYRFKNKIIRELRRLSLQFPERTLAKDNAKISPAIYACKLCRVFCYDGKSVVAFEKHKETYGPDLNWGIEMDHINPVVDPIIGSSSWDDYITSLFCSSEGWRALCKKCHEHVTQNQNNIRKEFK